MEISSKKVLDIKLLVNLLMRKNYKSEKQVQLNAQEYFFVIAKEIADLY